MLCLVAQLPVYVAFLSVLVFKMGDTDYYDKYLASEFPTLKDINPTMML